jgi:hypothetical protein
MKRLEGEAYEMATLSVPPPKTYQISGFLLNLVGE